MKPVVIIAIAVVCSVVAVLGVLVGLYLIAAMQAQQDYDDYQRDLSLAISYNQEHVRLQEFLCEDKPPPTSYDEAVKQLQIAEQKMKQLSEISARQSNLEDKMDSLQKKYPNSEFFTFDVVTCPYAEEWDRAIDFYLEYKSGN